MTAAVRIGQPRYWANDTLPDDMNFDETRCSDPECDTEGGAKVGEYIIVDRNTGHDKGQWADAYRLADGRLVCEDCASAACEGHSAIDSGPGYENEAIGTTIHCDGSCRGFLRR